MRIEPLGDSALVLRELGEPAWRVAERLNRSDLRGLIEAAASYDTVGVYGDVMPEDVLRLLSARRADTDSPAPAVHSIPVCYELGEDLASVASRLGVDPDEVARAHGSVEYTCFAVGFCPGFAYLGWLPSEIVGVPRRPSPRTRVEPGCVGLTGRQTAVYPLPRPGGWALIGRTPLTLVDVADGYFPIQAGDRVTFRRIDEADFRRLSGERL